MKNVDAPTLAASARRYVGLRRRYWRFWLAGVIGFATAALYGAVRGRPSGPMAIADVPLIVLFFGLLVCWVGIMLTWNSLMEFRCPQCGKRFILTWWSSWPTSSCKHCGLYLGESKSEHLLE